MLKAVHILSYTTWVLFVVVEAIWTAVEKERRIEDETINTNY